MARTRLQRNSYATSSFLHYRSHCSKTRHAKPGHIRGAAEASLSLVPHSLTMTTHQERYHGRDKNGNPSPEGHRFSKQQWNPLIYGIKARTHHDGNPDCNKSRVPVLHGGFNRI